MQPNAPARQRHGKRARMMELRGLALHGVVRNEPGVAATPQILGVAATRDVRLVLERHADRQPVEFHVARQGQVEDVLMVVVQETLSAYRLEVTHRIAPCGDRLDPGDVVLQHEQRPQAHDQFERQPWGARRAGDVEEERCVRLHHAANLACHTRQPIEIVVFRPPVVIAAVGQAEIVRRRCYHDIDRPGVDGRQHREAIAANQAMHLLIDGKDRPRRPDPCQRRAARVTRCGRIPSATPDRGSRGSARTSRCRLSPSRRPSRRPGGYPCPASD